MHNIRPTSQTAQVSGGQISYALLGEGPAVLISHGTLGGIDQGSAISYLFDHEKFSFLVLSMAGYPDSSAGTGRTAGEQARSYAELLDHLGIPEVFILGTSGGAPSALRFAADYPARCRGLVLISSISKKPELPLFFRTAIRMQDLMLGFDPLWKFVHRRVLRLLVLSNGVRPEQARELFKDPLSRKVVEGIYEPIRTASQCRKGLQLDDAQINSLPPVKEYGIGVPAVICHAVDDPLAPCRDARRLAAVLPASEYREFPDGGHLFFVVYRETLILEIERFMAANLA